MARSERRCVIAIVGRGETVHWSLTLFEDAAHREELRVVAYGSAPAVLEKRQFYLEGQSGEWRHGKVRGLTAMDLSRAIQMMESYWEVLAEGWKSANTPEAIPAQTREQIRMIRGDGPESV